MWVSFITTQGGNDMTLTELFDGLANAINKAELPFDAKVFVVRSISAELEQKYAVWKQQMQLNQTQLNKTESEEKQT